MPRPTYKLYRKYGSPSRNSYIKAGEFTPTDNDDIYTWDEVAAQLEPSATPYLLGEQIIIVAHDEVVVFKVDRDYRYV